MRWWKDRDPVTWAMGICIAVGLMLLAVVLIMYLGKWPR